MLLETAAVAWLLGAGAGALALGPLAFPTAALWSAWRARRLSLRLRIALALGVALIALLAVARQSHSTANHQATALASLVGQGPVVVRGVVDADRDEHEHVLQLRLRVQSVEDQHGWHNAQGAVLASVSLALPYDYGDQLELRGPLSEPAGLDGSDYRAYLARQGVSAEMPFPATRLLAHHQGSGRQEGLVRLRERLANAITSVLPEPESSLGAGIALGTRRVIEPALNKDLTTTGTAQIIVASGYNITVVSLLAMSTLTWLLSRRWAALLSLLAIGGYSIFVGLYPSVVRAAIMGVIVVLAALVGRPHSGMRSLILACALMLAIDPDLAYDLAFLLSVAGTAGLFLYSESFAAALRRLLHGNSIDADMAPSLKALSQNMATTFAATLTTMPVLAASFHTVSLASLPANAVLFPIVPAIMATSAAAAVAGSVWHPAAVVFAPIAYVLLAVMVWVVRACAALPYAIVPVGGFGARSAALASIGLVLAAGLIDGKVRLPGRHQLWDALATLFERTLGQRRAAEPPVHPMLRDHESWRPSRPLLIGLGLGTAGFLGLAGIMLLRPSGPSATLTFLDVGQGSAILIEAGGSRILVDGGPPGAATEQALDRRLAPWQRSLNLVLVTDSADTHVGGLPTVLQRYRVDAILDASPPPSSAAAPGPALRNWDAAKRSSGATKLTTQTFEVIRLGGAILTVHPGQSRAGKVPATPAQVVMRVGHRSFMLSGINAQDGAVDVEALSSSQPPDATNVPAIAILPDPLTTQTDSALTKLPFAFRHALVYRGKENGDVILSTDGHVIRVVVSRGPRFGLFAASGAPATGAAQPK